MQHPPLAGWLDIPWFLILLDLEKLYDTMSIPLLDLRAIKDEFPVAILRLILQSYSSLRVIKLGGASTLAPRSLTSVSLLDVERRAIWPGL